MYKRQAPLAVGVAENDRRELEQERPAPGAAIRFGHGAIPVSYTHLRAHETVLALVCRLLLEKKNTTHHNLLHHYLPLHPLHIYACSLSPITPSSHIISLAS